MHRISTLCLALSTLSLDCNLAGTAAIPRSNPIHDVWQFANGTWVENIAVRANGQLLVTFISSPELYQVDPFETKTPAPVHRLPDALSALGIAEIEYDIFAVISGNWSDKTFTTTPGSYSVWKVDVRSFENNADGTIVSPAVVTKITDLPEGIFLNGLTLLRQEKETILISDAGAGLVWRVNTCRGEYKVILEYVLMNPKAGAFPVLGTNGIHIHNGFVYFTNTFGKHF